MKVLILVYFVFFICSVNTENIIKFAAILYRHGDRTPVDPYPTDPYKNESYWPNKFGQLTITGMQEHFKLGQWLGKKYEDFVPKEYNPDYMYVRSTDVDRTLMSAQTNLAGMFPPSPKSRWDKNVNWTPFPVHTTPTTEDKLLAMAKDCPKYNEELHQIQTSDSYKKELSKYNGLMEYDKNLAWTPMPVHTMPTTEDKLLAMAKDCPKYNEELKKVQTSDSYKIELSKYNGLMEYLSHYTGVNVQDYVDILDIFSVLKIESIYKFVLPEWTKAVFPDNMTEPACHSFSIQTSTPSLARLKIGPLMTEIIEEMDVAMTRHHGEETFNYNKLKQYEDHKHYKMRVYSGHDLTIGNVLNGLGLFDGKCPEYTATIMMDLVYDTAVSIHFVKIYYKNDASVVEPANLYIPNCGFKCPLELFIKNYKHLIIHDWEAECKVEEPWYFTLMYAMLGALVAVFVILYLYKCYRKYIRNKELRRQNEMLRSNNMEFAYYQV